MRRAIPSRIRWPRAILPALLLASLATASAQDRILELDSRVEAICAAGGGRYLVLKLEDEDVLQIYDVRAGAIARTLDVGGELCVFGAGGDTILVYDPPTRELASYEIETLKRVNSRELAPSESIVRIAMGHARGDLALVRVAFGGDDLSQCRPMMFDTRTLRPAMGGNPTPNSPSVHNSSLRDVVHLRADGRLRLIAEWATSHSPTGVGVLALDAAGEIRSFYNHDAQGYLAPSDEGLVYAETGRIYAPGDVNSLLGGQSTVVPKGELGPIKPFPAVGGVWLLGLRSDGSLELFLTSRMKPMARIGKLPGYPELWRPSNQLAETPPQAPAGGPEQPQPIDEEWNKTDLTLDRRVYFIPEEKCLVVLPKGDDRLIRREVDVKQILDAGKEPYLFVLTPPPEMAAAGKVWTHAVRVMARGSKLEYRLANGPEGMTVGPDGVLSWKIPAGVEGRARVALVITDEAASRAQYRFTLEFR